MKFKININRPEYFIIGVILGFGVPMSFVLILIEIYKLMVH